MKKENIYLSREDYEKLRKELKFLKTVRRREISKAIGEAIAHGDISDNAEYNAAKDAQGLNEIKIAELEDKLSRGRIIDNENIPADKVLIGAIVRVTKAISTTLEIEIDKVHLNSRLSEDLGIDFLDIVELIMALEEEFNIESSDLDMRTFTTVGDIVQYISDRVKKDVL